MRTPRIESDAQGFVRPEQVRLPDHVGQRARAQPLGQGHIRPMRRIGREEIVAHWQQMRGDSK